MSAPTVLHYLGYDTDRGGIVSVIRALEREGRFSGVLGVNPGFQQQRTPPMPTLSFSGVAGETISTREFWRTFRAAGQVGVWLAEDRARIFHGHSRAGLLVGWWLLRRGRARVVVSVHCYASHPGLYRWLARPLGTHLYWLTPAMRRYYGRPGHGWEQCIPACVAPVDTSRRRGGALQKEVCLLGGSGALVEWKGWHLILQALAALPREVRERLRFEHVGGPDDSISSKAYASRLQAETVALGLQKIVEWHGQQPSSDPLLNRADLLVVASRNEPCSVAMLEALQRGVPVLAADSGGALDVIRPPHNGWLFRTGSVTSLAHALARLADPAVRAEVRLDPTDLDRFLAPRVAAQWDEIYCALRRNPNDEARRPIRSGSRGFSGAR